VSEKNKCGRERRRKGNEAARKNLPVVLVCSPTLPLICLLSGQPVVGNELRIKAAELN